jgi:hypothetical protein
MRTNAGDRKIGGSYGNGVYTITNIDTALGYAQVNLASPTPNELGWLESGIFSIKAVLLCELVDPARWRLRDPTGMLYETNRTCGSDFSLASPDAIAQDR